MAAAVDSGVAAPASAGQGLGEDGALLRDWDRRDDGRVEALRQGMERLPLPSAGGPEVRGQGGAGTGGKGGASDSIELFVEADGIAEDGEGEGPKNKEDKDLLKHRVWFWQVSRLIFLLCGRQRVMSRGGRGTRLLIWPTGPCCRPDVAPEVALEGAIYRVAFPYVGDFGDLQQ